MSSMMDNLQLSQRVGPSDYGCDPYQVVVSTANGDELVHEYCLYSSAYGGPVRPDAVTSLRAEPTGGGRATVRWEWSENSFDLASPGASFERDVIVNDEGRLAWAGDVRKTPKTKPVARVPKVEVGATMRAADVAVKSEWRMNGCDDEWEIHVSHAATGTKLVWKGTSTAENQDIKKLRHVGADGQHDPGSIGANPSSALYRCRCPQSAAEFGVDRVHPGRLDADRHLPGSGVG